MHAPSSLCSEQLDVDACIRSIFFLGKPALDLDITWVNCIAFKCIFQLLIRLLLNIWDNKLGHFRVTR